jgi:hypothetical protein
MRGAILGKTLTPHPALRATLSRWERELRLPRPAQRMRLGIEDDTI